MKTPKVVLLALVLTMDVLGKLQSPAAESKPMAFSASGTNEFAFDTGVLRVVMRAQGPRDRTPRPAPEAE